MALVTILAQVLCFFILSSNGAHIDGITGLLSRLYKAAAQNNRPLVLVIDRSVPPQKEAYPLKPSDLLESSVESDDEMPAVFLIKNHVSQSLIPKSQSLAVDRNRYYRGQYTTSDFLQKSKGNFGKLGFFRSTPSPIVKTLLRFKNGLRCQAKNDCQDKCRDDLGGNKLQKCIDNCHDNFDCKEEEDYDDPCDSESEQCGEDKKQVSTKGITIGSAKPFCAKC